MSNNTSYIPYKVKDISLAKGIDIYYNSRDHRFSSSGLRKQVKSAEQKK
jgi:glycerol-3-phosphate cytidylyltransferase